MKFHMPSKYIILPLILASIFNSQAYGAGAVFACNEFPPYKMEKRDTGLRGFDVDFLTEAFKRAGISLKIKYVPWKRALRLAQTGDVTGICSCSKAAGREKYIEYSDPLGRASSGLFSLSKSNNIDEKNLNIINGHSVGVVSAYNLEEKIQGSNPSRIDKIPNETIALKMFLNNRFDYYYAYEAPVRFYLKQQPTHQAVTYTELDHKEYYSCFSKKFVGYKNLLQKFNEALRTIKSDGTYDVILSKYH